MSDEHVRCRERQQRTADYAAHWRREAERTERAYRATMRAKSNADAMTVGVAARHSGEIAALTARVAVLEEALRLAEAAIEVTV